MPEEFLRKVLQEARSFSWVRRIESRTIGRIARARLWLNAEFVEVYYNAQTGSTSFAYIQEGKRAFGANNMRVGWHLHPFEKTSNHESSPPLSVSDFLKALEKELRQRGKLP